MNAVYINSTEEAMQAMQTLCTLEAETTCFSHIGRATWYALYAGCKEYYAKRRKSSYMWKQFATPFRNSYYEYIKQTQHSIPIF